MKGAIDGCKIYAANQKECWGVLATQAYSHNHLCSPFLNFLFWYFTSVCIKDLVDEKGKNTASDSSDSIFSRYFCFSYNPWSSYGISRRQFMGIGGHFFLSVWTCLMCYFYYLVICAMSYLRNSFDSFCVFSWEFVCFHTCYESLLDLDMQMNCAPSLHICLRCDLSMFCFSSSLESFTGKILSVISFACSYSYPFIG